MKNITKFIKESFYPEYFIKYVISSSDFGDTARLDLSLGTRGKTPNEKLFFDMFNFILVTLSDFKEEILNYYEDYKDKDVIKNRS